MICYQPGNTIHHLVPGQLKGISFEVPGYTDYSNEHDSWPNGTAQAVTEQELQEAREQGKAWAQFEDEARYYSEDRLQCKVEQDPAVRSSEYYSPNPAWEIVQQIAIRHLIANHLIELDV
ncbi:MAG TPA: hypothetical protein VK978_03750 [Candidatus Saccharimonadales bacterium]|nr:hypothetical protein [Candidatus Saccharimonadales bacterium]